jgi:ribosome assembly protein YihI (activator of Der GTPase)
MEGIYYDYTLDRIYELFKDSGLYWIKDEDSFYSTKKSYNDITCQSIRLGGM